MQHIWVCSCGIETRCAFDDMKIGGYFQCPACGESAVGVVTKRGRKEFVRLDRQHVQFIGLFDPPEPDAFAWQCDYCDQKLSTKDTPCPIHGAPGPAGWCPF